MDRRNLLQLAAVAAPGSALAQVSTTPDWKPEVFDAHQNETVIVLSELIIPATDTPGAAGTPGTAAPSATSCGTVAPAPTATAVVCSGSPV